MTTRDLLEKRASLVSEMRAITAQANGDGGDLSAEQAEKFNAMKSQLEKIELQVDRQKFVDEAERRMNGQNITGNGDAHLDGALEHYSFVRAVAGAAGLAVDDGLEREIDTELKKKSGRPFEGRAVPLSVLTHAPRTHGMNRAQ